MTVNAVSSQASSSHTGATVFETQSSETGFAALLQTVLPQIGRRATTGSQTQAGIENLLTTLTATPTPTSTSTTSSATATSSSTSSSTPSSPSHQPDVASMGTDAPAPSTSSADTSAPNGIAQGSSAMAAPTQAAGSSLQTKPAGKTGGDTTTTASDSATSDDQTQDPAVSDATLEAVQAMALPPPPQSQAQAATTATTATTATAAETAPATPPSTPAGTAPGENTDADQSAAPVPPSAAQDAEASADTATTTAAPPTTASAVAAANPVAAQQSADLARTTGDTPVAIKSGGDATQTDAVAPQGPTDLAPSAAVTAAGNDGQAGDQANAQNSGGEAQTAATAEASAATNAATPDEVQATPLAAMAALTASATSGLREATGTQTIQGVSALDAGSGVALGTASTLTGRADTLTSTVAATRQASLPNALEQIKIQVGKGLADGKDVISVRLHPEDMGRVEIKLEMKDGQVKASVTADRPQTLQMLKNDAAGLQQALKDAGLSADANSLSFSLSGGDQQTFGQTAQEGSGSGGGDQQPRGIDIADETSTLTQPAQVAAQGDDGLDIRV